MTGDARRYDHILRVEADWIARSQLSSGAIPTYNQPLSAYNNKYKVVPYFSHFAMLGVLENSAHMQVVREYMSWYFTRINRTATAQTPAGTVYDYIVETDRLTETATGDFDSTDSYASTFLNVLRKYAERTNDTAYLRTRKDDILLIADAMVATMDVDGLTWAKPAYRVKYLMDNTEVYSGLLDMEWIFSAAIGDQSTATAYTSLKQQVRTAIDTQFWSEAKQAYAYAKLQDGSLLGPDWSKFYPDATAQLFPIWTGVLASGSERAQYLYDKFNSYYPDWALLHHGDPFPWALLAYTAAIMGDRVRADRFLDSIQAAYVECGHPWPWYAMESGVAMLTAARLKKPF